VKNFFLRLSNINQLFFFNEKLYSEGNKMKKLILAICLSVGLSACAHNNVECNKKLAPRPQPVAAQPVVQPVAQSGCQGSTYTVSEPVEVIYKNTTYRTVYEPKTFSTTTFVKKPYNCAEGTLCQQKYNQQ